MARGDQHSYKGDARDSRERPTIAAQVDTRASKDHPGRNEDAALGDVIRLQEEGVAPPKVETRDPAADAEAIRQAREREIQVADKLKDKKVFGVLDGISGGGEGGGTGVLASRLASARISERMAAMPQGLSVEQTKAYLLQSMQEADQDVKRYRDAADASTQDSARKKELKQMGTTADVVALVDNPDGSQEAVIGHVGDSRVYLFDEKTKKLQALTVDENIVGYLMRVGQISRAEYDQVMNTENIDDLPDKLKNLGSGIPGIGGVRRAKNTIFNALGTGAVKAENVFSVKVEPGQKLMITSDGIHDNLTDAQLEQLLGEGKTMEDITRLASESGRKPDDVTGTLIEIKSEKRDAKKEAPQETPAAQAERMQREVQDAQIQVALLEELKATAQKADRMSAGGKRISPWQGGEISGQDLMKVAQMGGTEGVDRKIRDLKLEYLPKEYQLAQYDLARLQQDTGIAPQQAAEQLAIQKQIADWQEQITRAAASMRPGRNGGLDPRGVDLRAVEAVGERMKAGGVSAEQIIAEARAAKVDAERRMGDLVKLTAEAERLQKIAAEYHAMDAQRKTEIAAAERSQMERARQDLASAQAPEAPRQQAQEAPPAQQQAQPQKKSIWKRFTGLFS